MATVRREVKASCDAVWRVLSDGWLYPSWVVGASRMREVAASWPAVGAELHHSVGTWPALLDDTTQVTGSVPGKELVLRALGRPLGKAEIRISLEPAGEDTCVVVLEEDVISGPGRYLPLPLRAPLIATRNVETLQRLAYLAEGGSR